MAAPTIAAHPLPEMNSAPAQPVLLVEDDLDLAGNIQDYLEHHGWLVDHAPNGALGLHRLLAESHSVAILDLRLPGLSGLELCQRLRAETGTGLPVLMLTAADTLKDRLTGFEAGADDYLAKPFDFKEFLARVKALIKRSNQTLIEAQVLKFADLELDLTSKIVTRSGQKINLTAKEFQLMEYFLRNQEKVISKAEIAENIWEVEDEGSSNLIEVYVNYLRKKVDKGFPSKLIHTQFGMGYILRQE
jgi:two-component system copper resistance phosphate regulon response regulator CusR